MHDNVMMVMINLYTRWRQETYIGLETNRQQKTSQIKSIMLQVGMTMEGVSWGFLSKWYLDVQGGILCPLGNCPSIHLFMISFASDIGNYPWLVPWTITLSLAYTTYAATHLYHVYYILSSELRWKRVGGRLASWLVFHRGRMRVCWRRGVGI